MNARLALRLLALRREPSRHLAGYQLASDDGITCRLCPIVYVSRDLADAPLYRTAQIVRRGK